MPTKLKHGLNALIYPAPDVAGEWIAHCLELDLVTHGSSAGDAVEMLAEAIETVAVENVKHGRFALEFRSAPREEWQRLRNAERGATREINLSAGALGDDVSVVSWTPLASQASD